MFRQKIRKAMRLLDKQAPGWRAKVPTDERLAMQYGLLVNGDCGCVLVHVYGSYLQGLTVLDVPFGQERNFAFCGDGSDREYATLTQEWREELTRESSAE